MSVIEKLVSILKIVLCLTPTLTLTLNPSTLVTDLKALVNNDVASDITFLVEGQG
jgi:hypothetical protein